MSFWILGIVFNLEYLSFRILMMSRFQNCTWFLCLIENWQRYSRLKTKTKIQNDTVTFSYDCIISGTPPYIRLCHPPKTLTLFLLQPTSIYIVWVTTFNFFFWPVKCIKTKYNKVSMVRRYVTSLYLPCQWQVFGFETIAGSSVV